MVTQSWLYDLIIYIYALSLLFYFSDFVGRKQSAKRMGTGLLTFVWVLQTLFLIARIIVHDQSVFFSMFETLLFFSWIMVTLSLAMNYFVRMELLVFFMNVIGFAVLALNFFSDESVSPLIQHWQISDELLFIHISLAMASYAAFLVSAVCSGMYLFLHRKLKNKQWSRTVMRLFPSLDKIQSFTYYSVVIGTPLYILSLTLGVVWITLTGEMKLMLDMKVLNSFIIIAAYAFYFVQRISEKATGSKLAIWNLAAFGLVLINFVISNFLSIFHQWIWM